MWEASRERNSAVIMNEWKVKVGQKKNEVEREVNMKGLHITWYRF